MTLAWTRPIRLFGLLFAAIALAVCLSAPPAAAQTTPLSITFSASPNPVLPGETIVYRIVLANPSATTPTTTFTLRVNIPQFMTVTAAPGASAGCGACRFGNQIPWSVASLPPGASTSLQFTAVIDNSTTNPPPAAGTILTAQLSATLGAATLTRTSEVVVGVRPVSLSLSAAGRAAPGAQLTYTLDFGNTSAVAIPAALSVALPSGTSFVSASGGGTLSGGVVTWSLASIAPGFSDRRRLVVHVNEGSALGSLLFATAQLSNSTNQQSLIRDSMTTLVANDAPLSVTLSGSPDPVAPGGTVVYTLRLSNRSTNTATGTFALQVNIPRSMTVRIAPGASAGCGGCRFGNLIPWSVASLDPGESTILSFTAVVDNSIAEPPPPDGSVLTADATAFVFGGVTTRETIVVGSGGRLNLALSAAPDRVVPGAELAYTLAFGNLGTTGVPAVLSIPLPAGTSFVSAPGGTLSGGVVTFDLGAVAPGFSDRRRLVVRVTESAPAGTLLVANAELLHGTTQQTLVRESLSSVVASEAFLSLTLKGSPDPVSPGATVVYGLRLANRSTNIPTGTFVVHVDIPRFMTVTAAPGASAGCGACRFGNLIPWSIASLDPGESTVLRFTAVVDNSTTNPPPPTGTVLSAGATAFVFGGVTTRDTVFVGTGRRLNMTLGGAPDRVAPGSDLTYTLSFGNTGTVAAPAALNLRLPTGTSFVSATGDGALAGDSVAWNLGTLASGQHDRRELTVAVDDLAAPGSLLFAEAELVDPTTQQTLVRESASNLVAAESLLSISMTATPDSVLPGDTVVYLMELANGSTNTPTGTFVVRAGIPRFVTVTTAPGASAGCGGCRFGNEVPYSVSLPAGGNVVLQFTAVVDNSIANPPPPLGTLLEADATAFVFGGVRSESVIRVGSETTGGGGAGGNAGSGGTGGNGGLGGTGGNAGGGGITTEGGAGGGTDGASGDDGLGGASGGDAGADGAGQGASGPVAGAGGDGEGPSSGGGGTAGSPGGGAGGDATDDEPETASCSCRVGRGGGFDAAPLVGLCAALGLLARRRRRRARSS